jgi:osmotically-inducible protein OsmY
MSTARLASGLLLVAALCGPAGAGCAKPAAGSRAGALDDAVVSTRVKTALINDLLLEKALIDVDTLKGVVTLSGRVKSKEQEARALELARGIKGVTDVKSALQIQP